MLSRITLLLAVSLYGSCMEMRETVERMVMVRTSGSDLQPAATGYIYKKKNDGEESVIEMGESEVMEHLAKYYKQPQSYKTQTVAADVKEGEEKEALKKDERVIPVSEESEEKIDGLANDDFKKILEKYGVNFDDRDNYDHYSRGLGDFDDGYYLGYGEENKNDDKNTHYYGSGVGDYNVGTYKGYTPLHNKEGNKGIKASNDHIEDDDHKLDEPNDSKDGKDKREKFRFQKTYDNDQKGRKYYDHDDGVKFAFYKYGGNKYLGDQAYGRGAHETGDHDTKSGKNNEGSVVHGGKNSDEEQDSPEQGHYGSEGARTSGKSFSFEIKH